MYEELADEGLVIISVALDQSGEDIRPFIEEAKPAHPSLIDTEHVLADLYGMVNIPTAVWIDEDGNIVRPNEPVFGSDMFKDFHGMDTDIHKNELRAWVREGKLPFSPEEIRARQMLPTRDEQLARTEFTLAWHLHGAGHADAAERHFVRAGELSPNDFMVRRGSMPIRGLDPMGEPFFELYEEWQARGRPYYQARDRKEALGE
jgi:hypothetical protein